MCVRIFQSRDDNFHCFLQTARFVLEVRHKHKRATLVPPTAPSTPPPLLREERLENLEFLLILSQGSQSVCTLANDTSENVA